MTPVAPGQRVRLNAAVPVYGGCCGTATKRARQTGNWVVRLDAEVWPGRRGLAVVRDDELTLEEVKGETMKYIEFKFTDGMYRIPAYIIARDRASYYAQSDVDAGLGKYDDIYQKEFDYSLSSDDELIDWLRNNMNWSDLEQFAARVADVPAIPHQKQWDAISSEGEGLKVVTVDSEPEAT